MTRTVVGLFEAFNTAQKVVRELVESGFARETISLIASDAEGRFSSQLLEGPEIEGEGTSDSVTEGAEMGVNLGGVSGLLSGITTFTITDLGPVIAAGPLIAALRGRRDGGMTAALTRSGVPEKDADIFVEGIRKGGTLVIIYTGNEASDRAAAVMNRHSPMDLDQIKSEQSKRREDDEHLDTFSFQKYEPPEPLREASSRLDYGPGARSFLPGQAVSAYDREKADMGRYQDFTTGDWSVYESRFREDFNRRMGSRLERWEDFRDIYRYGFERGADTRYAGHTWETARSELRFEWELRNPQRRWDEDEVYIHQGWLASREGNSSE
ncbi:MAG: hypothetical protein GX491_10720 [Chloroflexi bacterium]|nr:hypothetical protein [Chloroflexota bacterium]